MAYQPPPQYPAGQPPPDYYSPGQVPPGGYPPEQLPPGQRPTRRRGCGGCGIGCLVATLAAVVILVIAVVAGAGVVRQMFPTAESVEAAAACAITRVLVNNAENGIAQSDATAAEKEQARRELERLREEFSRNCT